MNHTFKCKTIKLLEKNRECLQNLLQAYFLYLTPKAQSIKEITDILDLINLLKTFTV